MQKKLITIFKNIVINRYWYVFIISIISLFVIAKKIVDLKSKNQFTNLLFNNLYLDEDYNEIIEDFRNNYDIILLAKGQRKDLIEFASFIKPRLEEFDELVLNVQFKKSEEFYRKNFKII